jgi:conjugal transfer pilus assembly protein TraW
MMIQLIISLIFFLQEVHAKDFGVVGKTWEIKEKDAIEEIKRKLTTINLEEHNDIVKQKMERKIRNPTSLNIPKAVENRVFYYDPTIEIKEDLKDYNGKIFHKAGTKINPLDRVSLPYKLIFFDANDEKQLEYVIDSYEKSEIKPKLILTGGSPIELEEQYNIDFYFDQNGILVKKLGIKATPAVVSQSGNLLKIKEVYQ